MRRGTLIAVSLLCLGLGVSATATERVTVFDQLFLLDSKANDGRQEAERLATNIATADAELEDRWSEVDTAQRAAAPIRDKVTSGLARWLSAGRMATRDAMDGPQAAADTRRLLRYAAPRALPDKLRDVDVVRRAEQERSDFELLLSRRGMWSVELARNSAVAAAAGDSRDVLVTKAREGASDDLTVTTEALATLLSATPQRDVEGDFHRLKGTLARPVAMAPAHRFGTSGALVRPEGWTYRPEAGAEVHAVHDGVVSFRGMVQGQGLVVAVDHASGYRSTYNHLASSTVSVGDKVARADVIAAAGESGSIDGVRLHFTLRKEGKVVDPAGWFLKR